MKIKRKSICKILIFLFLFNVFSSFTPLIAAESNVFIKDVGRNADDIGVSSSSASSASRNSGGIENVTVKSVADAFGPKNIAMSAVSAVGLKLLEQVQNKEPLNVKKAVSFLASGEYLGSFIGSGLGTVAGTAVGALISSSVPVAGPVIGAFMPSLFSMTCGDLGKNIGKQSDTGEKPSFQKAWASIDKTELAGRIVGSTVGAAIGTALMPGIGTAVGSMVGGMVGSQVALYLKTCITKPGSLQVVVSEKNNTKSVSSLLRIDSANLNIKQFEKNSHDLYEKYVLQKK
ncbi:MAG TPA: hypothetical protein PKK26_06275 [Candidatus Wallbacteria bacterium]|nr:hypothetical protein [Candidatus Wallbacteria bacterium]